MPRFSRFGNNRPARRSQNTRRRRPLTSNRSLQPQILRNIVTQKPYRQVFTFRANAALPGTQIYKRSLLNLLWMALGSSTGVQLISSIKIGFIVMSAIATGGAGDELNTIAFEWNGGALGSNKEITSRGSISIPARIVSRPPRNSAASFWLSGASSGTSTPNLGDLMFTLSSLTTGVMIDIGFMYELVDGSEQTLSLTSSGASSGLLYTNSLDNSSNSGASVTPKLLPVGRVYLQAWG